MEFPWWIFFGTLVTFAVAILFEPVANLSQLSLNANVKAGID